MSISRMIIYSSSLVAILAGVAGYISYGSFSHLEQTIIEAKDWKSGMDQLRSTILIVCFSIFIVALICGQFIARCLNKTITNLSMIAKGEEGKDGKQVSF